MASRSAHLKSELLAGGEDPSSVRVLLEELERSLGTAADRAIRWSRSDRSWPAVQVSSFAPLPLSPRSHYPTMREVKVAKTLAEALDELKRDPARPVRADVQGMTVEVRVITQPAQGSAAELLLDGSIAGLKAEHWLASAG